MDDARETDRDTGRDDGREAAQTQARDEVERRKRSGRSAAAARIEDKASWVDQQVRIAMARGDFDDLPGAGKPIADLGSEHDRDWWLKKLVEREQVTGVLPPSLQLRKDDAELDAALDALNTEAEVRRAVEEFNARVIRARYTPVEGPPLVTMPREVDHEVESWAGRRAERLAARRTALAAAADEAAAPRRSWWRPRTRPGRRGIRHTGA